MLSVSKNLATIREKIKVATLKRPPELQHYTPRLVAVSKTKPKELVIEAYKAGQIHFGENYVQELVEKGHDPQIQSECPDIKWHFIGHLQMNKVKKLIQVPNLYIVETVDSEKLATSLNKELSKLEGSNKLNIFLQVNTSGEEEKSGCSPDEVVNLVKFINENCEKLQLTGLMTIGMYDNYNAAEGINPDFKCLVDCRLKVCKELGIDINNFELSMGMSADFEHAIEVGSTNVRVGSSIFGGSNNFGFRKPYQVLVDGTLCHTALKNKVHIENQFKKYLEGEVKLLTTECNVIEVDKLGPAFSGASFIIKQYPVHKCGHSKNPVTGSQCILHMISDNNPSRYIVATQDRELQKKCRGLSAVPLLYLHMQTPTLEVPSEMSKQTASEQVNTQFQVSEYEKRRLELLDDSPKEIIELRKKRKRKGGPNPLSCKKKKTKVVEQENASSKKKNKTRKRKRDRFVQKVKKELMSSA